MGEGRGVHQEGWRPGEGPSALAAGRGGGGQAISYKVLVRPQALPSGDPTWDNQSPGQIAAAGGGRAQGWDSSMTPGPPQPHSWQPSVPLHTPGWPPPTPVLSLVLWKAQRHLLCHGGRAISRPERGGVGGAVLGQGEGKA